MASNNPADYIHPIIQAWMASQQLAQRQREFIASQEQETLAREQRVKEFEANLKLSQQNADRMEKAQNLVRNSAVAAEAHRIRNEIATGLRKPQTVNAGNGPLNSQLPFYVDENNPLGPVVAEDIVTPRDLALQKEQELAGQTPLLADRAGLIRKAQIEAEEPARQAERMLALEKFAAEQLGAFSKLKAQADARMEQIREQGKLAKERQAIANAGRMAAAQAGGGSPEEFATAIRKMATGDSTKEDVRADYPKKFLPAIMKAAESQGIRGISKTEKVDLTGLSELKMTIKKYEELNNALNNKEWGKAYMLNQEADKNLAKMAKIVGGNTGAVTDADAKYAKGGKPVWQGQVVDRTANARRIKDLKDFHALKVDLVTGGMTDAQKKLLEDRWKLKLDVDLSKDPDFEPARRK